MADDFRTRLEKEVAALDAPPLGDLVRNSMHQGRRLRSVRRWQRVGAVTAASLAVAGIALGVQASADQRGSAAVAPDEARVQTTPAGLLAALLEALPAGQTSNYAGTDSVGSGVNETPVTVQTYLDDGRGPGLIRLSVWTDEKALENEHDVVTVNRNPENCIQSLLVSVEHSNGVVVQVTVASCLPWDGHRNPEGRMALTEQQATVLAEDERLGLLVPERLADEGARRFPDLPTIE